MPLAHWSLIVLLLASQAAAGEVEYLESKPLADVVRTQAKPVGSGKLMVPLITWGGDVATIEAHTGGFFKQEGLDTELFLENNFPKQVEACLSGKSPFLRGTMGMINSAAEVFKAQDLDLSVVYQLTWSTGGDTMVVRPNIKSPLDLKNRTLALQLYGPHMDYVANILHSAEVPPSSVHFKWLRELTLPTYDTGGKIVDTVNAFINDPAIDAAMVISPDALNLTSGGGGGTGAAGSVKGAKILLSTKTASRIIADVYAVRSDYFAQHRGSVEKFVRALMKGQQQLVAQVGSKDKPAEYPQLLTKSADLLLGTPKATADVEGMLGDCEFVGYAGNVQFFSGQGTTRSFATLNDEIQTAFAAMGLIKKRVAPVAAHWDYAALAGGLGVTAAAGASAPRVRSAKGRRQGRKANQRRTVAVGRARHAVPDRGQLRPQSGQLPQGAVRRGFPEGAVDCTNLRRLAHRHRRPRRSAGDPQGAAKQRIRRRAQPDGATGQEPLVAASARRPAEFPGLLSVEERQD